VWFLGDVQFRAFAAVVYRYLRKNPPRRRRRRKLSVADLLRLFLLATRHNLTQRLLAERFEISQSSVARALTYSRELVHEAFGSEIGDPEHLEAAVDKLLAASGGQGVVLVDGTIVPMGSSAVDRENYSGKVHRVGKNIQVVTDMAGRLLAVSRPLAGRTHDKRAIEESGFTEKLRRDGLTAIADRGYEGSGFKTPCKWYTHKPFTIWDLAGNLSLSKIRNAVERGIAHFKVLAVLKTGVRTRATDRDQAVGTIIVSALALFFFRQKWRLEHP
jgi:hypothetical protein